MSNDPTFHCLLWITSFLINRPIRPTNAIPAPNNLSIGREDGDTANTLPNAIIPPGTYLIALPPYVLFSFECPQDNERKQTNDSVCATWHPRDMKCPHICPDYQRHSEAYRDPAE